MPEAMIAKYIGQRVEIIYVDQGKRFTKRSVFVLAVGEESVKAYCLTRKAPRSFRLEAILAVRPLNGRRSNARSSACPNSGSAGRPPICRQRTATE